MKNKKICFCFIQKTKLFVKRTRYGDATLVAAFRHQRSVPAAEGSYLTAYRRQLRLTLPVLPAEAGTQLKHSALPVIPG